jgi:hypothetical protein
MLITDSTSGSAAYVGMTRGRADNIAHLVTNDTPNADSPEGTERIEEARAIWNGVMGRDWADLGPTHAADLAAQEMERYAPQRPRQVVLNQLQAAWSKRADLAEQHDRLDQLRERIEDVMAIQASYQPGLDDARIAERAAYQRWKTAQQRARDLEATITSQERDLSTHIWQAWRAEQSQAHQATAVLKDGAGAFGQHRHRVREAREDLRAWAGRWEPVFPELVTVTGKPQGHTDQIYDQIAGLIGWTGDHRVREAITAYVADTIASAHPERDPVVAEVHDVEHALRVAEQRRSDLVDQHRVAVAPHGRLAHASDLAGMLARTEADLDALTPQLAAASERVHRLTSAPEIRSMPAGNLDTLRDQWQAERIAHQQEKAAQARRSAALAQARSIEEAARDRLRPQPDPVRRPENGRGPGIGF